MGWRSLVDVQMIPSKLAYFCYGAILGLHLPYLVLVLKDVGLDTSQAGFISGLRYASGALAGPILGYLADVTGRRKLLMVVVSVGSAFPIFAMPWIANSVHPKINCTSHINNTLTHACSASVQSKEITVLFYILLAVTLFGSLFVMSMPGYVDSIVIHVVKSGRRNPSYGAQRIFGSIGFTIANLLGGIASDHYKTHSLSQYTAVFYMYLPSCLILIPIGCYLVGQASWDADAKNEEKTASPKKEEEELSILQKVYTLFKSFDVIIFMLTVFISGLGNSLFLSFSFLLVKNMGVTDTQMSVVVSAGSASEILIFPLTSRIISKVGTAPCITIGIFSYLVRFLTMSYAKVYWVAAMANGLHCIGFALSWAAMMEHTHKLASPEISGTLFNVMCGLFYNFSALLANMVGGVMYDKLGGSIMFRYVGTVCGVWTLVLLIYYASMHVKNKKLYTFENSIQYNVNPKDTQKSKDTIVGIENPINEVDDEDKIA